MLIVSSYGFVVFHDLVNLGTSCMSIPLAVKGVARSPHVHQFFYICFPTFYPCLLINHIFVNPLTADLNETSLWKIDLFLFNCYIF